MYQIDHARVVQLLFAFLAAHNIVLHHASRSPVASLHTAFTHCRPGCMQVLGVPVHLPFQQLLAERATGVAAAASTEPVTGSR